ncbi:MAG: PA2778 family cysteine peptidase [Burkholderiaceae bacterium]|nr:PA2778 family cysteine peptidase [Burkholderiaceae bacterium]
MPGDDGLCGPAVLAMLLAHAGALAPLAELVGAVYLPGRAGSLQAEMLAALRRRQQLAVPVDGGWPALRDELAAGLPVAALVNLALPLWPRWHYLVVTAIDPSRGAVRVHSGQVANAWWSTATFESVWARSGRWAFVAPRTGVLPASVDEAAGLRALLALDHSAGSGPAALWWPAAARRWPASLTAHVGAAQALEATGDTTAAIALLRDAARRLDRAVLWNNLGVLLLARGDLAGAEQALARALAIAEATEPDWLLAVRGSIADLAARRSR